VVIVCVEKNVIVSKCIAVVGCVTFARCVAVAWCVAIEGALPWLGELSSWVRRESSFSQCALSSGVRCRHGCIAFVGCVAVER